MNETEDPNSADEEIDSSDAVAASVPGHLLKQGLSESEPLRLTEQVPQVRELEPPEISMPSGAEAPLRIWCPDCGQELHILREYLGMQGKCQNCSLPIVANMHPEGGGSLRVQATRVLVSATPALDENESMRIKASKVVTLEDNSLPVVELEAGENDATATPESVVRTLQAETTPVVMFEEAVDLQQDVDPLLIEEADLAIPLPSWMAKSTADKYEAKNEGVEDENSTESIDDLLSDQDYSGEEDAQDEGSDLDSADEPSEDGAKSENADAFDGQDPSWVKGGNPWDALGLNKLEPDAKDEVGDENKAESKFLDEDAEESQDFPSLLPYAKVELKTSEPEIEDSVEETSVTDETETETEDEESSLGLIMAAVIILLVGGAGVAVFLKPDLVRSKAAVASKAVVESSSSAKGAIASDQDKPAIEKPAAQDTLDKKSALADADDMHKGEPTKSQKEQLTNNDPKAVERPQGLARNEAEGRSDSAPPTPQMATTRAEIHDGVALRMHQEGERTIRSFYRASSVEERSAFVLRPSRSLERMRSFYLQSGALPTLRYVEFVGLVSDPTSGFRFGVFDVHEKENETSHRWSVVEVDPGRYAMDWGLYEQLEGSTLVAYLAKPKKDPERFRLLMKLGESVLVQDSPWSEEAIKVYLQLPLASSGTETILMKRSMAKKTGILGELAGGKMKIGQIELEWVAGDKDPGSKVPTITGFDGWGAWSKLKMRGLK